MNFSVLKSKIISNKTQRFLKNRKKQSSLHISSAITTVGIIVNEGSAFNFESLKKLQRSIGSGSGNFHVLTYKTSNDHYNEFRGTFFTEKDFSWDGRLKSVEVDNFLATDFDMLIDYTKSDTIFKRYLVAKSKAKFKVGYANIDETLYDFMINVDYDGIEAFNDELIKYLKILKKL